MNVLNMMLPKARYFLHSEQDIFSLKLCNIASIRVVPQREHCLEHHRAICLTSGFRIVSLFYLIPVANLDGTNFLFTASYWFAVFTRS